MRTQFKRLLAISVTHAYYGGPCPDVAFTIPDDTRRVLGGGRLLAKILDKQLIIFYEADTSGAAPLVNAAGTRLRFGFLLTNASFGNFTVLPIAPRGSTLLYDNAAVPGTLSGPTPVMLSSSIFAHVVTGTTRPVTVTAMRAGAPLQTDTVVEGRTTATFDLRGIKPGRFDVREVFAGGTTHITPYYLDPESQRDAVFAVVEIDAAAGFYTTPPTFSIAFDAKEQALRYYVVVSNYSAPDVAALSVGDAGFVEEGRTQIAFAAGAIDATTAATLTIPGSTLLLFESQVPVRRRAVGRRKIQLKKNNAAIIENLPQPAATNPTADLIVHLSKPKRP